MSTYRYTSWGRTRRPKPASGKNGDYITGSTLVDLNQLDIASTASNATIANGVYQTENQRYAHIACSGSSTVTDVLIYSHAIGNWHKIVTGSANSSVYIGNDEYQIVDINGADYLSVVSSSNSVVTMAFSTF